MTAKKSEICRALLVELKMLGISMSEGGKGTQGTGFLTLFCFLPMVRQLTMSVVIRVMERTLARGRKSSKLS